MSKIKQELITDSLPVKRKRDRFNGKTEEEVLEMTLPDHLVFGLDIVIIGINPGLTAAYIGHHYAGPGNHFWKCLYLSGLIPEPMNAYDDVRLKEFGIGFTNIVSRTSRSSSDLTKKEIKEGAEILQEKIRKYQPKVAVFNGKGIYEVFCGHKNFFIGKQPELCPGTNTILFVMPSSSARCSQLPRAVDKLPFYAALKKLRDYLKGDVPYINESELIFPDLDLKVEPKKEKLEENDEISSTTPTKRGRKKKLEGCEANCNPAKREKAGDFSVSASTASPLLAPSSLSPLTSLMSMPSSSLMPMPSSCLVPPTSSNSLYPVIQVKEEPPSCYDQAGFMHWMYNPGQSYNHFCLPNVKSEPGLHNHDVFNLSSEYQHSQCNDPATDVHDMSFFKMSQCHGVQPESYKYQSPYFPQGPCFARPKTLDDACNGGNYD